jgi:hypothetical protein
MHIRKALMPSHVSFHIISVSVKGNGSASRKCPEGEVNFVSPQFAHIPNHQQLNENVQRSSFGLLVRLIDSRQQLDKNCHKRQIHGPWRLFSFD